MNRIGCFTLSVILLAITFLFGIAWSIAASAVGQPSATTTPQPAALIAEITTAAPEPTATSTVTPWPTADLRYLEAAKAEAEIAEKNANAAQSQANAQSTIVANAGIIATITKAYEYDVATQEAGTATAAPSMTAQAYQIILRVNDETLRTQQESEKSRNESVKELIAWSVGGALVLMVGVVIAYAVQIGLHNMAQKVYDQRDQIITAPGGDDFLKEMIPATMIATANGSSQFEHVAQITRDEWYTLRRAAVALGGLFSRRKLDGSNGGEKYFTDTRAREILAILQAYDADDNRYGQPHTNDMTLLTAHGWAWLKLNPAPSPTEENTKIDENTVKTHPNPPQNTEGEVKSGGEGA